MPQVTLEPLGLHITSKSQGPLLQFLQRAKVLLKATCGGAGTCGTCVLRISSGAESLSPIEPLEDKTLKNINKNSTQYRLTCQTQLIGNAVTFQLDSDAARKLNQIVQQVENKVSPRALYHPSTGKMLIPAGQIINRRILEQFLSDS